MSGALYIGGNMTVNHLFDRIQLRVRSIQKSLDPDLDLKSGTLDFQSNTKFDNRFCCGSHLLKSFLTWISN